MSQDNQKYCKTFLNEKDFQKELFYELTKNFGWTFPPVSENREVFTSNTEVNKTLAGYKIENFEYWTEDKLIDNWRKIISSKNWDRLEETELTEKEIKDILWFLNSCIDPSKNTIGKRNELLLQGIVELDRNGKKIPLKIFSSNSTESNVIYQVAREVITNTEIEKGNGKKEKVRFDFIFLIDGIPVVSLETKTAFKKISSAKYQVQNYHKLGLFTTGFFSLIQMFVVMNDKKFFYTTNKNDFKELWYEDLLFKWTDENNRHRSDWCYIVKTFLRASTLHNLIGLYSVADGDNIKILRSYQYWAIKAIKNRLLGWDPADNHVKNKWQNPKEIWDNRKTGNESIKLGYIWHSTGAGKTLTSFKVAQLLLKERFGNTTLIEKVIFLVDRKDLSLQTQEAYLSFNLNLKNQENEIKKAKNKWDMKKLIMGEHKFIIGSHQKLSEVCKDLTKKDKEKINSKRIVLIFDEAHRSTSAEMFRNIKETFINACLIGFTGTPKLKPEKEFKEDKNEIYTEDVFGPLLHTYTMGNAILDKKVLKFYLTYSNLSEFNIWVYAWNKGILRKLGFNVEDYSKVDNLLKVKAFLKDNYNSDYVWLMSLKKLSRNETEENIQKFNKYLLINKNSDSKSEEEQTEEMHLIQLRRNIIVDDIIKNWKENNELSKSSFSSILATNKIDDAIEYFKIFKERKQKSQLPTENFKFTAVFDATESNDEYYEIKENTNKNINMVMDLYSVDFNRKFNNHSKFKENVIQRLSKRSSRYNKKEQHLNLVIVVNQLLTGFDSKYIKTIYIDKSLEDAFLIQAISRTNRIFKEGNKEEGNVVFYNKPPQMQKNIDEAIKKYAKAKYENVVENPNQEGRIFLITQNLKLEIGEIKKIVPSKEKYYELSHLSYIENEEINDEVSAFMRTFIRINKLWNNKEYLKHLDYKGQKADDYFRQEINFSEEEFLAFKSLFKQLDSLYDVTKNRRVYFSYPIINENYIEVFQITNSHGYEIGQQEIEQISKELSKSKLQNTDEKEKVIKTELEKWIKEKPSDTLFYKWGQSVLEENKYKNIFFPYINNNFSTPGDIENIFKKSMDDWRKEQVEEKFVELGVNKEHYDFFWNIIKKTNNIKTQLTEKQENDIVIFINQETLINYFIKTGKIKEQRKNTFALWFQILKEELQNLKDNYKY
ncbi:type I restriction endonuclease subunit R [Mycoplasma hyorhinis]|uniref:type I restriction enzyme subunit R domain-containing protein n=1 Tax=Mesomycoplasma hyorhinis TaxID=2100 RepID=UPI001368893A|nr:DEAD/DEAH box helicase family protein [Mesomycoplasma hyorhinis]MXR38982.1 type I restriction endonuclease subunit R [Mesomycoplasma hyorhinis]